MSETAPPTAGDRSRRRVVMAARLLLAGFLNVAASSVPAWRLDPGPRPAVTLVVGGPVLQFPDPVGPEARFGRTLRGGGGEG